MTENILLLWRNKVQAFCFYWKESQKRGRCKEVNGHYCVFCELADAFDADIANLVRRYGAKSYRAPAILAEYSAKVSGPIEICNSPMNTSH